MCCMVGNHLFVIFAVLDVSCAVNLCINHSFLHLFTITTTNYYLPYTECGRILSFFCPGTDISRQRTTDCREMLRDGRASSPRSGAISSGTSKCETTRPKKGSGSGSEFRPMGKPFNRDYVPFQSRNRSFAFQLRPNTSSTGVF